MPHAGGRPLKYETPEQMQRLIDLYFLACRVHKTENNDLLEGLEIEDLRIINDIDDIHPTVSGLAYTLGMTTHSLRNYEQRDEFFTAVSAAKQRIELNLEQCLHGSQVTGPIFSLKTNFGWAGAHFPMKKGATPAEMSNAIMEAISKGHMLPEVGATMINALKSMVDIDAATEMKARIEEIEETLGVNRG